MREKISWPFTRLYDRYPNRIFVKWFKRIALDINERQISGAILDIGTGPGRLPVEIARQVDNARLVGIDLSGDMIKMARKHAEKARLSDRITFEVASAYNTGCKDSSIDLIVSTGMVHHLKEPIRAFNEMYRILKPGGQAWIFDGRKDATRAEFEETVRRLNMEEDLPIPLWIIGRMWRHWHVGCSTYVYTSGKIGMALRDSLFRDQTIKSEGAYVRIELKK